MNNQPTVELTLDLAKVNLIIDALAEMPYRISAQLISEIQKQATDQLKSEQN